jgi:hypothetical protein
VDGTGSGSCPVAGFGISGVEPSGFSTRESVIKQCLLKLFIHLTKRTSSYFCHILTISC